MNRLMELDRVPRDLEAEEIYYDDELVDSSIKNRNGWALVIVGLVGIVACAGLIAFLNRPSSANPTPAVATKDLLGTKKNQGLERTDQDGQKAQAESEKTEEGKPQEAVQQKNSGQSTSGIPRLILPKPRSFNLELPDEPKPYGPQQPLPRLFEKDADIRPQDKTPDKKQAAPSPDLPEMPKLLGGFTLDPKGTPEPHEGTTNYDHFIRPAGKIQAVMIFVDFPDAPRSTENTRTLRELLPRYVDTWYREASYNRCSLELTVIPNWFRMPKPAKEYDLAKVRQGNGKQYEYITDATRVSHKSLARSKYQIVYVVAAKAAGFPACWALSVPAGNGIRVGDHEIRHAVSIGNMWQSVDPIAGALGALAHETGHVHGLPDLHDYRLLPAGLWKPGQVDAVVQEASVKYAANWDVMSLAKSPFVGFLAWHKWKLGWITDAQIKWMDLTSKAGSATLVALEHPQAERSKSHRAIVVRTGDSTAYVIEARHPPDPRHHGLLVYSINSTVPNGSGPIQVKDFQPGWSTNRPFDDLGITVKAMRIGHMYKVEVTIKQNFQNLVVRPR